MSAEVDRALHSIHHTLRADVDSLNGGTEIDVELSSENDHADIVDAGKGLPEMELSTQSHHASRIISPCVCCYQVLPSPHPQCAEQRNLFLSACGQRIHMEKFAVAGRSVGPLPQICPVNFTGQIPEFPTS